MNDKTTQLLVALLLGLPSVVASQSIFPNPNAENRLQQQAEAAWVAGVERQTPAANETAESGARHEETTTLPTKGLIEPSFNCFPTCNSDDGRFVVIAFGSSLITLSDPRLEMRIGVERSAGQFILGFFDGDGTALDANGESRWDLGNPSTFTFRLLADPSVDGTGTVPVELLPGQTEISSDLMANGDWTDFTVTTGPEALSPSGHFFYRLIIELDEPSIDDIAFNAFKVRSDNILTIEAGLFSYIANFASLTDGTFVFPDLVPSDPSTYLPSIATSNYDGTFDFFFDVPPDEPSITVHDGDFDFGKWDRSTQDVDDPDTSNGLVTWATEDTRSEGAASGFDGGVTGDPPDDFRPDTSQVGIFQLREPSVTYDIIFPDGQMYHNPNPSGNREWEAFRMVATSSFDRRLMDYAVPTVPAGIYQIHIEGVDMQNLNALRAPFRVLCVDELGNPCRPLLPFRLGDTVFLDLNGDQIQSGSSEVGIPGVVMLLTSPGGEVLGSTTTDANGNYFFDVGSGSYTVIVAPENFAPGGALEGLDPTIANQITDSVVNADVLTYDFGYLCLKLLDLVAAAGG